MAATNTALLYTTVGQLRDLRDRTKSAGGGSIPSWAKPTRSTLITDQYSVISPGGSSADGSSSEYMVQNLIPNTTYSLKFKMYIYNAASGFWEPQESDNYITPTSVGATLTDSDTIVSGTSGPNQFYWSNAGGSAGNRQLLFITEGNDGTAVTGSGFGATRDTYNYDPTSNDGVDGGSIPDGTRLYNLPPANAEYSGFLTNAKTFSLGANGKPMLANGSPGTFSGSTPIPDQFDAYLFLFERTSIPLSDLNKNLTNAVFSNSPSYIGRGADDDNHYASIDKGFKKFPSIQATASSASTLQITVDSADFTTGGKFGNYNSGQGLKKDFEYVAGLMFVNRTSKYVVDRVSMDGSTRHVEWVTNVIPTGGVWSVTLGGFYRSSAMSSVTSDATSVGVRVDSIGVQGALPTNFRIQIFAEPYTP